MPVRNPYTEGGTLPDAGEPPVKKPGQKDPLDRVLEMKTKIAASKQLDSLIQEPQADSPSTPPFSFTGHFDLGQVITSAQNSVTELQKQNATIMSEAQKERFQMLQGQLAEMKTKLESSTRQPDAQQNPLQIYREVKAMLTEVSGELRKDMGFPTERASVSDLPSLLELKKIELDHTTRDHQWMSEERRKDREWRFTVHRWEEERKTEDRRWQAEFNQKKAQLDQDRERGTRTMDIFSDFAEAAAKGIDLEQEAELPSPRTRGAQTGASSEDAEQGAPMQMFFKCLNDGCGTDIPVEDGSNKLVCPSCKSEYIRKKSSRAS